MRNRFQKQRKIDNKIRIFLPVMICGIMVAVLWNSSSQIFRETKKRQEESLKEAVIKGAVQCYSVEGRYPESLSYMEKHYGLEYDKDEFVISYEIIGSNRMPQVTVIPLNERTKTYDRSDVSCDLICSVCSLCVFLEYDRGEYI